MRKDLFLSTKGHGYIKKTKAYGAVGAIALMGIIFISGNTSIAFAEEDPSLSDPIVLSDSSVPEAVQEEDALSEQIIAESETTEAVEEATIKNVEAASDVGETENSITFSEDGIVSTYEEGVSIDGTALKITESGSYTVTGNCSDGSISIAKGLQEVILTLQNLTLSNSETAPIIIGKNSDVTIINEGTTTITDAEDIANEDSSDFEGAAIKVKSGATLTLDGSGTLNIDGSSCKNGIKGASSSTIIIDPADLTLNVFAANNGIASDNEVIIKNGTVNVTAGNDGIKSEPDEDDAESAGIITIYDGIITIDAQGDGIQATGDITIYDGTFTITTFGGHTKIDELDEDSSAKGIKSDTNITIYGGDYTLDICEDGIHSDGDITILDGIFDINAGDDAVHADYVLTLGDDEDGPTINVYSAVEGLEGASVYIKNGSYYIVTSDDGINAANSDLTGYAYVIDISGGDIFVNAEGDGLDSNGSIYISGGTTIVYGSSQGDNAAADYGDNPTDEFVISGGTVLLVGQNQMAVTPTSGDYIAFGYNMNGQPMGPDQQMPQDGMMLQDGTMPEAPEDGMMPGGRQDSERPPFDDNQNQGTPPAGNPPEIPENGAGPQKPQDGMMEPGSMDSAFGPSGEMPMEMSNIQIKAGDVVSIVDQNGNTVYKFTALKSANSVLYSSDSLSGDEYDLLINGAETSSSENVPIAPDMNPTNTEKDQEAATKGTVSSGAKEASIVSVSNSGTINAMTTTVTKAPVLTGVEAGASIWASMTAALGLAGTALFRKKRK